jgi:hypothetical protein
MYGSRIGRFQVDLREPDRRNHREGIQHRPELTERPDDLRAMRVAADVKRLDGREGTARTKA